MSSKSDNYFVSYKCPQLAGDKLFVVGPYSEDVASFHAQDIESYGGITQVKIYQEDLDELLDDHVSQH